ncbi:site-2 protease family protein [Paenibacillus sp. N1-5-1-14]|uniref:site-2 protease family protein n=1 Tax=Paenibacillus radicibacter TaxID=2972488 RepID=UPI002158B39A|nr:site-2 protease family protein [Paenibacillus radicibacter]MCR8644138.1 site-2 protease family protein [Paenibacillus radicibacter]
MIKCFGITFSIHPLFTIVLILSIATGYMMEALTLFSIVLIHELGHVAAIRVFGWRLKVVRLLPFGGVAEVEESGNVPAWEELVVAIAGPAQHIWMIGFAWGMKVCGVFDPAWWDYFIEANLMLGLFNLLPILPLDGGRMMQCAVSYFLPFHQTIRVSIALSLILSAVVVGVAIHEIAAGRIQLSIAVVGVFLLVSNWYAWRQVPFHFLRFLAVRGERGTTFIHAGTLAQPIVVAKHRTIEQILKLLKRERYHLVYVVNESGKIQGVLPEQRLLYAFFYEKKQGSAVSELFM